MVTPSHRTANFTYAIRNLARAAEERERAGKEVLYFNIGDPQAYGFRPPEHVTAAVEQALRTGFNGYAPSAGLTEAREAVAAYASGFGAPTSVDDVLVTSGASEAADLILSALVNEGDEVLVPAPGYPLYAAILNKLGACARYYTLDEASDWQPSLEEIKSLISKRTRAIVLINPSNPTGSVMPDELVVKLLDLAAANDLLVIADEVYRELCFGDAPQSASVLAQEKDVAIVTLESLSKTYMIPGWRVGWMRFTHARRMRDLILAVRRLADGRLCAPTLTQYAVRPALEGNQEFTREFLHTLKRQRDFTLELINRSPHLSCVTPAAAFYVMINASRINNAMTVSNAKVDKNMTMNVVNNVTANVATNVATDEKFVLEMLAHTGVLVVHGSGFAADARANSFRFIYLADETKLEIALTRIMDFTARRTG